MKIFNEINEKYNEMSKSHKLISDFILNNRNIVPFLSIIELSDECRVSTSTITRYSRLLGFNGFTELQKQLKREVTTDLVSFEEIRKLNESNSNSESIFNTIVDSNIRALEAMRNKKTIIDLNEITDLMIKSKDIYIVGSRSSMSVAYYLYFLLKSVRKDTFLISNQNDGFIKEVQYIDKDDLLISISYSKYTKFTYRVTEYFKLQHSKIVAITDSTESPLYNIADKTLIIKNGEESFSFVSTMTILNILVMLYNKSSNLGDQLYEVQDLVSTFFDVYL